MMTMDNKKIAVLIEGDNADASLIDLVLKNAKMV